MRNDITTATLKAAKGLNAKQHEEWAAVAITRWVESNFKGRLALTWNAVLNWPIEKVWKSLGTFVEELEQRRHDLPIRKPHSSAKGMACTLGLREWK